MEVARATLREILIILFSFLLFQCKAAPPDTLRLVHTIFRHGDRSPTGTYPNDPYNKDIESGKLWPKGLGQLTTIGMNQHHMLGQYFRTRYDGFLPRIYNSKNVVIRSTDVDRTLMSAQSHLSGLYPPVGTDKWDPALDWQPIPVHTVPVDEDHLLRRDANCPRYRALMDKLLRSPYIQNMEKENKKLFDYLAKNSGMPFVNITNTWQLFDILHIEELYNLTLPKWVTDDVYQRLSVFDVLDFVIMANTTELKRLVGGGGLLVKEMLTHWMEVSNGKMDKDMKFFIYSAHDSTVANLLHTLGVMNGFAPPYASCVIMELHEVQPKQFSVQVSYKNESNHEPYELTIPGCQFSCPLDKVIELSKPVIPLDIAKECELPTNSTEPMFSEAVIYGLIASIGFLLIFLQAIIIYAIKRKRGRKYRQLNQTA
ncbi:prostatic acid phosphatase-like [Lineus longissimus]|uniref:prostatic acid phosphatase-like n=1 Tax=Lineus longissimus TaxID=88925 RepID=UPI002B4CB8AE